MNSKVGGKDCFFDPVRMVTIDVINPTTGRGVYGKSDLAEARARYGDQVVVADIEECHDVISDHHRSDPVEISKEDWWEMFEVLPPVDYVNWGKSQSFKMMERQYGSITGVYCRLGSQYFRFYDDIRTTHSDIVEKCQPLANRGER